MTPNYSDFYEILQVDPQADATLILYAFRYLATKYHPENTLTGSKEMYDRVVEAFRILSDDQRRAAYDHERKRATDPG